MVLFPVRSLRLIPFLVLLWPLVSSCSDDEGLGIRDLAPLVGVWDAQVLSVPNPENPGQTIDLIEEGASYALSVLASGQYTAVFDLIVVHGFETGTIEVSGSVLTLTPTGSTGTVMSGSWMFQGATLVVDALRELDYDLDGEVEVVPIHIEMTPRED
jgi:hypothetical protein